jgi:uncharacterized protein YqeY
MSIKDAIQHDIKEAMKARDSDRLTVLRFIMAAVKQREVDERITLTEADLLAVLDKQVKQRRESIDQYEKAGRADLVASEKKELVIIQTYLPEALTESEIESLISSAIAETGAKEGKDMGKVMAILKPKLQGRADIKAVSELLKQRLA